MLTKTMIAIATLTFAASLAQAGGNDAQIDKSKQLLRPMAGCVVKGQPSEFPNDIALVNKGLTVIKAGTTVKWSVPLINANGSYKLTSDLAPGKNVALVNVLPGGVEAGSNCKVSL